MLTKKSTADGEFNSNPTPFDCGHPARFLSGRSAQSRLRAQTVQQLAAQAGLPYLREYLVSRHIVLYAHSEADVVLLALNTNGNLLIWLRGKDEANFTQKQNLAVYIVARLGTANLH